MNNKLNKETVKDNNFTTVLNRSKNSIAMNIKYVFLNKSILIMIALFYMLSLTLGIIFVPFYLSGGMILLISVIIPGLIILGSIGSNLKKSSLYANVMTSGISRKTFYLSQLISTIIIVNILSAFIWIIIWFLGNFNVFLDGWVWEHPGRMHVNPFAYWTIIPIAYITNVTALLIFSVYFLIDSITNDRKTYNIVIAGIFVIGMIFGGSLNTYFARPYHYWLHDFPNSIGTSGIDYFKTSYNGVIYVTEDFYNATNGLEDLVILSNEVGIEPHQGIVPNFMFVPTLIFNPFYAVGEFTSCAVTKNMTQNYIWHFDQQIIVVEKLLFLDNQIDFEHIKVIDSIAPIMFSKNDHVSVWSWFMISFDGLSWMWTLILFQPFITIFAYIGIGSVTRKIKRS